MHDTSDFFAITSELRDAVDRVNHARKKADEAGITTEFRETGRRMSVRAYRMVLQEY